MFWAILGLKLSAYLRHVIWFEVLDRWTVVLTEDLFARYFCLILASGRVLSQPERLEVFELY